MRLAVLLGNPVAHSRSPAMFNAAFKAKRIAGAYVPWQLALHDLEAALHTLRVTNAFGANVTVPHKQAVMPFLDEVTPLARSVGAVNCITVDKGRLIGDNTDVYGFAKCVRGKPKRALIIGAGGAARAVVAALPHTEIHVCNKSEERRIALQRAFPRIHTYAWSELDRLMSLGGLVVHATSAEVNHQPITLTFSRGTFIDLTYGKTPLVAQARKRGLTATDGSAMLLHQAARAFTLWTGVKAPLDVMRHAIEQKGATRRV